MAHLVGQGAVLLTNATDLALAGLVRQGRGTTGVILTQFVAPNVTAAVAAGLESPAAEAVAPSGLAGMEQRLI